MERTFTRLLREGNKKKREKEEDTLGEEVAAIFQRRGRDAAREQTTASESERLTWEGVAGHHKGPVAKNVKDAFARLLSKAEGLFNGAVDVPVAALFLCKTFYAKNSDKNKDLQKTLKLSNAEQAEITVDVNAVFDWHKRTGGKAYFQKPEKPPELAPVREYGADFEFNFPFSRIERAESAKAENDREIEELSVDWLFERCADFSEPLVAVTEIINILHSDLNVPSIQDGLFEILGESRVALIWELVSNLPKAKSLTRDFYAKDTAAAYSAETEMRLKDAAEGDLVLPKGTVHSDSPNIETFAIPAAERVFQEGQLRVEIIEFSENVRQIFKDIKTLNAMQSACFGVAYKSSENMLVCAPTGAGKTNVALMAIARQIELDFEEPGRRSKIVYVTPMKALAAEITAKFGRMLRPLRIAVAEFTGDMRLSRAQIDKTDLIVTTPEKWDVVTRKESDIVKSVHLLIIDEVHLLNEDRGPVIETIIARTKMFIEKFQIPVRIVGLSATLPNYMDVATFLGVNQVGLLNFGAEYRPVPLSYTFAGVNDKLPFYRIEKLMDEICYEQMVDALAKNKQLLVFVHSRKSTFKTAQRLLNELKQNDKTELLALSPDRHFGNKVSDSQLKDLVNNGFGAHNAGMPRRDRDAVERLFSSGHVRVLVCTATLAWGVNLPAHKVVIKGTSLYNPTRGKFVNLGGLDVLQIFGRAGRPQFDDSGSAVLITTKKLLPSYIRLLSTQTPIESQLETDIENHLNAEIVSGTVTSVSEAVNWLAYTYLFVRMLRNPLRYGIPYREIEIDENLVNRRRNIVMGAVNRLLKSRIVRYDKKIALFPTSLGRVASHYYIHYKSIDTFIQTLRSSNDYLDKDEILFLVSSSMEFEQIKVREEELKELKELNVPLNKLIAKDHFRDCDERLVKVAVLIQAHILQKRMASHTLASDMNYINQNLGRIVRAIFEICLAENLPNLARKFMAFAKTVELQIWEDSHPLAQFKRLENGIIEKLKKSGISIESILNENDMIVLGEMIRNQSKAREVFRLATYLPKMKADITIKPITKTVLKFIVVLTPDFKWDASVHGDKQYFWVWLEDSSDTNFIHFKELVTIDKKAIFLETGVELDFIISISPGALPTQFILSVISDKWMGPEMCFATPGEKVILPAVQQNPFTPLFDLLPLPVACIKNLKHREIFSFPHFNPIQTQIFHIAYHTDNNILLGAPTGTGKTAIAELAILRVLAESTAEKIVYIAPLKALAREKNASFSKKFNALDAKVAMLTGDITPEAAELNKAKILITTPEKWDGVSRHWRDRRYVRMVALIVIDEVHLLGSDRGSVLEAIISRVRYISESTKRSIRIVALSTALANADQLAKWLGVQSIGLYNFQNTLRTVPLTVHVAGYPGQHYCPRMNAMNKPTFHAIMAHSPDRPVIVFVSSRRQTRLTAFDLINFVSRDFSPRKWLRVEVGDIAPVLKRVKDENLRKSLEFGIGLHHAGLVDEDRRLVEEMFSANLIQILVCTATLAWGVNFPARLVVVKGTEYYDAKTRRYVELPLTDVLQMVGRAGRQGFDETGVACLLVHEAKKPFYLKFLHEPFPLESTLHENLRNHINAEIASGEVDTAEKALDYVRWTFLYQRVSSNPSYYGLADGDSETVASFVRNLVETVLEDLEFCDCVQVDRSSGKVTPLPLGKIASLYYVDYKTVHRFYTSISSTSTPIDILKALSSSEELKELPMRHNEDTMNAALARAVRHPCAELDPAQPSTKAFLLFQCHLQRRAMPVCDYDTDLRSVLDQSVRLAQAMADVCALRRCWRAVAAAVAVLQRLVQALWFDEGGEANLPHFSPFIKSQLSLRLKTTNLPQLGLLPSATRLSFLTAAPINLSRPHALALDSALSVMPFGVRLTAEFEPQNEPGRRDSAERDGQNSDSAVPRVSAAGELYCRVVVDDAAAGAKVWAPRWPKPRRNGWFLVVYGENEGELRYFGRVRGRQRVRFAVPQRESLTALLMSDSYVDLDRETKIN